MLEKLPVHDERHHPPTRTCSRATTRASTTTSIELAKAYGGEGYRVFSGKKGAMKQLPLTDVAHDTGGDVLLDQERRRPVRRSTRPMTNEEHRVLDQGRQEARAVDPRPRRELARDLRGPRHLHVPGDAVRRALIALLVSATALAGTRQEAQDDRREGERDKLEVWKDDLGQFYVVPLYERVLVRRVRRVGVLRRRQEHVPAADHRLGDGPARFVRVDDVVAARAAP